MYMYVPSAISCAAKKPDAVTSAPVPMQMARSRAAALLHIRYLEGYVYMYMCQYQSECATLPQRTMCTSTKVIA